LEKDSFEPLGVHVHLCAGCFHRYASFILTHRSIVEEFELPSIPKIMPLEGGLMIPCKRCKYENAVGYIKCPPLQKERVERREKLEG